MKTRSVLCLFIAFLLLLPGCGGENTPPGDTGTPEPEGPVWRPLPEYDPSAPRAEKLYSHEYFVETAHGVVFLNDGLRYMDKETGEVRLLCGDPECRHDYKDKTCPAVASYPLLYVPENGRLYFARQYPGTYSIGYDIVSVGTDEGDLTPFFHTRLKEGDQIGSLRYWNGRVYYTRLVYEETEHYQGPTGIKELESISLTGTSVRSEASFSAIEGFTVQNGVVYMDSFDKKTDRIALCTCDLDTGTETELYVPELRKRKKSENLTYAGATFLVYDGRIFCFTDTYLKEIGPDGNEIGELWRNEDPPYDPMWRIGADGTMYSLGYDPHPIETTVNRQQVPNGPSVAVTETVPNLSGGNILRWKDGVPELFADLGERTIVEDYTVIGETLFMKCRVYDDEGKSTMHYYYTFGGRAYEIPKEGLPQG